MSIKIMSWVWQHSQHKGSELLLLLAIADYAHDDGTNAFPSIETLAAKTRMSQRATQYGIRALEEAGAISIDYKGGPRGANVYSVCTGGANFAPLVQTSAESAPDFMVQTSAGDGANQRRGGAKSASGVVQPIAPDPSLREPPPLPVTPPSLDPLGIRNKSEISENFTNSQNPENDSENSQDAEGSDLWPKWYALGYSVPGWKASYGQAETWRLETNISEQLAEVKVYALRDWWQRLPEDSKRKKKGDPYLTWQNWCRQDRDKFVNIGSTSKPPSTRPDIIRDYWDFPDDGGFGPQIPPEGK